MAGAVHRQVSTPYGAGTVHDFMHAKVTRRRRHGVRRIFNLSRRGEQNAENVLEIEDAAIAERFAAFVDDGAGEVRPVELPAA